MNVPQLLNELNARGIQLRRTGCELTVFGDQAELDASFLTELRAHKDTLLGLIGSEDDGWWRPPVTITPEMLPLVQLTAAEIEQIVRQVPGGASNVQDIYALAPLQEGILFHHLLEGEGDPYLTAIQLSFDNRARLEAYLEAMRAVIDRHDILRTAVLWEGLPEPVQVVWRHAVLPVEEVMLDAGAEDVSKQLYARFNPRRWRIDIRQAPLLRVYFAYDRVQERWLMMQLLHHLSGDHVTVELMREEIQVHLLGQAKQLPPPLPFRNLVAQARLGVSQREHEDFFRKQLGDVDEPTAPFGLLDVHGDGTGIEESKMVLDESVARRLRKQARRLGVSAASLCHLAWALVLSRVSGREDVVFGTVLFGRMQGGAGSDRTMGLFMNTLPVRIRVGEEGVEASVRQTHMQLGGLMRHEHASLALAQRCSGVPAPTPLFSALLNYRHSSDGLRTLSEKKGQAWQGIRYISWEERTNYPLILSVTDTGEDFVLTTQAATSVGPMRVCEFMHTALNSLVEALENTPGKAVSRLEVLGGQERQRVLYGWNQTAMDYPREVSLAELIETQVAKTPNATAVIFGEQSLTYGELNQRANELAWELVKRGAGPEKVVGIFLDRSLDMVVALLAVLKSGAAYLPLDPYLPQARLAWMTEDSGLEVLVTQRKFKSAVPPQADSIVMDESGGWHTNRREDLGIAVGPEHLAYLMYTSGSTGKPKGVQVPRGALVNFLWSVRERLNFSFRDRLLAVTTISFDIAGLEIWLPLLSGARVIVASREAAMDGWQLKALLERHEITFMQATPATWWLLMDCGWSGKADMVAICGGEALPRELAERLESRVSRLWNFYGPTETTIWSTAYEVKNNSGPVPVGRPLGNTQCYILDSQRQSVPMGVMGELYIAGDGLARGYLNRAELTAEKFVHNPFSSDPAARMYRTGDLARYLPDGNIEYLGRTDHQVKIRGFRIELGEIETALKRHAGIEQAVVAVREEIPNNKRLVAYFVSSDEQSPGHSELRNLLKQHLPDYMVPSDYVALRELPLTPNGKIDRKALPPPGGTRAEDPRYVAPRDAFEQHLCEAWATVLGVEKVSIHDNFFDLGGNSLLAVQLWLRVQRILPGEQLPLSALLEAPTVEQFAVRLRSGKPDQYQPLVRMRAGTSARPPFFCVHGRGGNVLNMRPLAMALPADLPFYCFQAKGLDGSQPFESVEKTARCYVEEMRRVQPHGPYYLGGTCYGGLVAFEMAQTLEELGEAVAALVLLDTANPAFLKSLSKRARFFGSVQFYGRRAAWHARTILSKPMDRWLEYINGRGKGLYEYIRKSDEEAALATAEREMAEAAGTPLGEKLIRIIRANHIAASKFVPKPYRGDVLIFRASERYLKPFDDYYLGWGSITRGGIECFEIEGDHMSILEQPAVELLAKKLDAKLLELSTQRPNSSRSRDLSTPRRREQVMVVP
jgi:amino acid adenylation domain-containing protein